MEGRVVRGALIIKNQVSRKKDLAAHVEFSHALVLRLVLRVVVVVVVVRRGGSLGHLHRCLRRGSHSCAVQTSHPRALPRQRNAIQHAPLPDLTLGRLRLLVLVVVSLSHRGDVVSGTKIFRELGRLPLAAGRVIAVCSDVILWVVHVLHHAAETNQRVGFHRLDTHGVDLGNLTRRGWGGMKEEGERVRGEGEKERDATTKKINNAKYLGAGRGKSFEHRTPLTLSRTPGCARAA